MPDYAPIPIGPNGVELTTLEAMFRFAELYLQSGLAPSSYKTPQQLVIVWAKGAELGLSPMQATDGMTIINNRVGIMGDLALAMVRAKGLLAKRTVTHTGTGDALTCEVLLQRKGEDAHTYSFSVGEAKAAQIYERSPTWKGYPKRMTYYRALGFGLRDEFSDILKGTRTVEELQDMPEEITPLEADEAKVAANQEREKTIEIPGAKFVEPKPDKRPTPAEAAEPAFEEDKAKPAAPEFSRRLEQDFPQVSTQPPAPPQAKPAPRFMDPDEKDEIDMTPVAPQATAGETPPKEPAVAAAGASEPAAQPGPEPAWKSYIIRGIGKEIASGEFFGKRLGDLSPKQLEKIKTRWLPALRTQWDDASQVQKDEMPLLEAAVAYYEVAKPW